MRRGLQSMVLVLLLTGFTVEAQAQRRGNTDGPKKEWAEGRRGGGPEMRLPNLTDEQKEQIKAIVLNGRKETLPLRNAMREKRAELQTLRTSENYDERAVNSTISEIAELQESMMLMREQHRQEIREVLTEEQRIIFDSRSGKRSAFKARFGRGGRNR